MKLSIYPKIGVARAGNSPNEFCIVPDKIGGLPYEYDIQKGVITQTHISKFKDAKGLIKRQGQPFRIFDDLGEVIYGTSRPDVKSITWTVHLANKKAEWYDFDELKGNLLFSNPEFDNSYDAWVTRGGISLRNSSIGDAHTLSRMPLIFDPGPRRISGVQQEISFKKDAAPKNYKTYYPPTIVNFGHTIETLGDLHTDSAGRLIVLGGHGLSGGDVDLNGFGGGDGWHDDISDGPIYCTVEYNDGSRLEANAWCIVGSPDFAPEIVNITNLNDTVFDVYVRSHNLIPNLFEQSVGFNKSFIVNFQRDVKPIFDRMKAYHWVANVQPMVTLASVDFFELNKPESINQRRKLVNYFRGIDPYTRKQIKVPEPYAYTQDEYNDINQGQLLEKEDKIRELYPQNDYPQEYLFANQSHVYTYDPITEKEVINEGDIFPLMPLNSGSNSVRNENPLKFLALTETQLFFLHQWAEGKFDTENNVSWNSIVDYRDTVSIGNCIGLPMSPGIEVTWNLHNPNIFDSTQALSIKSEVKLRMYDALYSNVIHDVNFLTPTRDECSEGSCQPGDLTKRMACPWQADFVNCSVQDVNFTNPTLVKDYIVSNVNKRQSQGDRMYGTPIENRIPTIPLYYAYWWPPQSPWDVLVGDFTKEAQIKNGNIDSGRQMNYQRGINSYQQMVEYWDTLAFIKDVNYNNPGFPFMVETERNHDFYGSKQIPLFAITLDSEDNVPPPIPVFFIDRKQAREERLKQHAPEECVNKENNTVDAIKLANASKELVERLEKRLFNPFPDKSVKNYKRR